ncbi:kin17-like protein (RNA metabolism proteins) [Cryptosporidium canis]|uniref:Kin17-like protein (RNA metabolism proteins) n=1 Tax=Cryptosporidium canis TaxID=195482 RepID=A0A9D5DKS6_9CRYT|nr:kin17-like protein (RNA metabolism proteins) [Cryptosporidium canis]
MPKAEIGTVKWFSKQIKSRGLQKLRWYCQLCEKQCRDENGFKCHRMSEAHLRQMELFEQNSKKILNDYSKKFEFAFMKLMKTRYSKVKVLANTVYNDVIHDKDHVHMNSTIWTTLTEFIHYLSDTNKCIIENSDRGWYIQYVDHDAKTKVNSVSIDRHKFTDEYKKEQRIGMVIKSNLESNSIGSINAGEPTALLRSYGNSDGDGKITIKMAKHKNNNHERNLIHNAFTGKDLIYEDGTGIQHSHQNDSRNREIRSSSLSREGY